MVDFIKFVGLNIDYIRAQGYDHGFNMEGQHHKGVQNWLLHINPRAPYTPCVCHNLNIILYDMDKCRGKFFFLELCNGYMYYSLVIWRDEKFCFIMWKD